MAGTAVWRDSRIRDLSWDRFDSYHADTYSRANERRRSHYSQSDRGAGFGEWANNGILPVINNSLIVLKLLLF